MAILKNGREWVLKVEMIPTNNNAVGVSFANIVDQSLESSVVLYGGHDWENIPLMMKQFAKDLTAEANLLIARQKKRKK